MKAIKDNVPDPLYFFKVYGLEKSSNLIEKVNSKKSNCRYCGKSSPEVKFKQVTHLLPELLGCNDIYTVDECDSCNALFSGNESHLSIFIRPYITLVGIKGKYKVPKFQSRTIERREETRTALHHSDTNKKKLYVQETDDYVVNEADKTFEITFRKPPFTPLKVYKALLKIGLSLMSDDNARYYRESFEWLLNKSIEPAFIASGFMTTLHRVYFSEPAAYLYRVNKNFETSAVVPEYSLVICFANQVLQIFLPFSDKREEAQSNVNNYIELNYFPAIAYESSGTAPTINFKTYNFETPVPVTEDHKIVFSFDSVEINSLPITGE